MSRIVVFDLGNVSLGEFTTVCDRGWMVNGTNTTSGGGTTKITVNEIILQKGWLQPGRMVFVEREGLPAWAGVIDTPISILSPAPLTLYDAAYLLKLRSPESRIDLTGTVAENARRMIEIANGQEETFVRLGTAGGSTTAVPFTLDQRPIWDQLNAMVAQAQAEMVIRPKRESSDNNRLYIYVDILDEAGVDTGFLLHDGENGNARILNASIEREIWNRVTGINGAASEEDRLVTAPQIEAASSQAFRLRSKTQSFNNAESASSLLAGTQTYLADFSMPVLKFDVLVMDVGNTFANMDRGNTVILHTSKVILPDGRLGWRGTVRIMAMAYNERENTLGMTLEAAYEI
ncbi:MAG: hypothetical protein L0287_06640 [Anaerolineae bacterium]|nr:hypothetical protein [Anaerolineae bacterium]